MKLIVGLGNIGKEYEDTRHNVGFMAIDAIASSNNVKFDKQKFNGSYTIFQKEKENILLLKPERYINLSGEVVIKFVKFYDIALEDILVISDDLDIPVGRIRLKCKGSSGGHNGLKNIEFHLKTQDYKRVKIGISNNKQFETKDYVLGKFKNDEKILIEEILHVIPNIFDDFLTKKYDNVMNQYNRK